MDTKRRFFQLVMVSDAIRNLFAGGAKFSPMEAGLALCWVPIPGPYKPRRSAMTTSKNGQKKLKLEPSDDRCEAMEEENGDDDTVEEETNKEEELVSATTRAAKSGRYGLMDEAAELMELYATKRMLQLSVDECLELLEHFVLVIQDKEKNTPSLLSQLEGCSPGAMVGVCRIPAAAFGTKHQEREDTRIWLSCVLVRQSTESSVLNLLTEVKLAASWLRILRAITAPPKSAQIAMIKGRA